MPTAYTQTHKNPRDPHAHIAHMEISGTNTDSCRLTARTHTQHQSVPQCSADTAMLAGVKLGKSTNEMGVMGEINSHFAHMQIDSKVIVQCEQECPESGRMDEGKRR